MARADSAGASSNDTFIDTTGPKIHVTGVSTTPRASSEVLASRFTPPGWDMAIEKKGSRPWASAWAGQAKNHRKRALSPQPQGVVAVGWSDHTPHHTTRARARYPAAARASARPRPHRCTGTDRAPGSGTDPATGGGRCAQHTPRHDQVPGGRGHRSSGAGGEGPTRYRGGGRRGAHVVPHPGRIVVGGPVSYTHLTLPTIYSV